MSDIAQQDLDNSPPESKIKQILQWISIVLLVYLLIVAVGTIGAGFKSATGDKAQELFTFATNPFLGLIVGTVATALIQSSSTVSSIMVGLVAGGLPVTTAVPMIMGANTGTSITNTLVSLGHIGDKSEFQRAFAAATIHDFFNLLTVVIFLPLEIFWHPLEKLAHFFAQYLVGNGSLSVNHLNFVTAATQPIVSWFQGITHLLPEPFGGIALIILGIALIFLTISLMGKLLKVLMVNRAQEILQTAIGKSPLTSIAAGTLITVIVQSSSTTTSLMIPLAGAGVFGLAQIYPFTLGANIGTCITALLAATAVSGPEALPALEIAMVHLLYNSFGVILIYNIPFLYPLPMLSAQTLAAVASERKFIAFVYIIGVFFLIPGILLAATAMF
ncbi:MAG: Na/Pi cotransporter family protein [Symploca sp. SIO1B1]|nr:Na/Pi cotransporter family protein [Symploca sp. SIO1B1]